MTLYESKYIKLSIYLRSWIFFFGLDWQKNDFMRPICLNFLCFGIELGKDPEKMRKTLLDRMCGRCYDEDIETFPAPCQERPEKLIGVPMGMYHCPDCGCVLIAGLPHPTLCKRCLDRKHPAFDKY